MVRIGAERRHHAGRCFLPLHSQSIFVEATHYTRARILWQLTATPNARLLKGNNHWW